MKGRWTLSLPQTSRANPVQFCSTYQKKKSCFLEAKTSHSRADIPGLYVFIYIYVYIYIYVFHSRCFVLFCFVLFWKQKNQLSELGFPAGSSVPGWLLSESSPCEWGLLYRGPTVEQDHVIYRSVAKPYWGLSENSNLRPRSHSEIWSRLWRGPVLEQSF